MDKKSLIQQKSQVVDYSSLFNSDFAVKNILDEFVARGYHFLVDANISYKPFIDYKDNTWAVRSMISGINGKTENSGWANHIDSSHILNDYARDDFKNTGIINLTSPMDGSISSIFYDVIESTVTCGSHNKTPINTVLTGYSSGATVYACQNLSFSDFSTLVWAVTFPKFILFTNERCLGSSSASLPSFSIENKKIMPWYFKLELCLKNH